MKFILIINQQSIIDNGLDLDFEDASILQFINDFTACDESVKRWKDNRVWAWIQWQLIINQIPMLRKRDSHGQWQPWRKDTVYTRVKLLESRGYLHYEYAEDKQWVALTTLGKKAIGVVQNPYPETQKTVGGGQMQTRGGSDADQRGVGFESDHISNIEDKSIEDKGERERAHVREKEVAPDLPRHVEPSAQTNPPQYPEFVQVDRQNKTVTILGLTFANDEAKVIKAKVDQGLDALKQNKEWYWWWDTYGVKVGQQKAEIQWFKWNNPSERERTIWHTAVFAHVTPLEFRPEPWRYLKDARFNDDNIIDRRDKPKVSQTTPENSPPKGNLGGKTDINVVV